MNLIHLCRRAVGSFRNNPLSGAERNVALGVLLPDEFALWSRMQFRDQRHSLQVLEHFVGEYPSAVRDERAAALLHDVGKSFCNLGWWGRILATVVGPRTARFAAYLDHERIGNEALVGLSTARTLEVLNGDITDECVAALRRADNV